MKKQKSVITPNEFKLIESIKKAGSMSGASRILKVQSGEVKTMLNKMESLYKVTILHRRSGGLKGGGSQLTYEAEKLIRDYKSINK